MSGTPSYVDSTMQSEIEHRRIDCGEVRLDCALAGRPDRPLVVLLHGFPESWYSWHNQIDALATEFHVAAPSLRGYGESDRPRDVDAYRIGHLTADVLGLIRGLGHERAHVVGHDWGGGIAWAFTLGHPEAVEKLAVLNCPHPAIFTRALRSKPRQMLRSWYFLFFQLPRLPEWLISRNNFASIDHSFRGWVERKDREVFSDADLERTKDVLRAPGAITAAINYYRAAFRHPGDLAAYLSAGRIAAPTLLVWAEKDRALGKELTYGMEGLFSGPFTVKYIPDCGHWVQHEQPQRVNEYLLEFLR